MEDMHMVISANIEKALDKIQYLEYFKNLKARQYFLIFHSCLSKCT